jgi:hypothetical protein
MSVNLSRVIRRGLPLLLVGIVAATASTASATLIEGWNGSTDGWTTFAGGGTAGTLTTSTATGVTEGTSSLEYDLPDNNGGFQSPSTLANTVALSTAPGGQILIDIFAPSGTNFLGTTMFVNNPITGFFQPAPGFTTTTLGAETTLTFTLTAAQQAQLAASAALSQNTVIGFNAGFATQQSFFYDNLRDNVPAVVTPEPASLGCLVAGSLLLLRRRRHA